MTFKKAVRENTKIKLAITGASGSGKTYSALRLATGLAENGRIALIDTENNSASLYAGDFEFDVASIEPPFHNDKFIRAIQQAEQAGYDVVILDSASHFWEGILEYKDMLDKRGGNSFTNWGEASKQYKGILNALLQSNIHLITCMRSKTEYVLEPNEKGKHVPKKVGLAPIMRDGIEFEFTVVFNLDFAHQAMADKDRTGIFTDKIFLITEQTGKTIGQWLKGGSSNSSSLKEHFEHIGKDLYGVYWEDKRKELAHYITKGAHNTVEKLSNMQLKRLIEGMKRKMQPETKVNGSS